MFWMRAYPLRGELGGGWALEFESFLGPEKWHRADRRVPFGAQKTRGTRLSAQSHFNPLPLALLIDAARIKSNSNTHGAAV